MLFYFVLEKSKGWGLRMNRPPKTKLAVALGGVFLALSAMSANAAGLGKLSINSALGQPLSAEIELVSLQPGEFESIKTRGVFHLEHIGESLQSRHSEAVFVRIGTDR